MIFSLGSVLQAFRNLLQYNFKLVNFLIRVCEMARLRGVEPLTLGSEVRCSVQLSYRRL